jgi:hypothetical protein
VRGTEPACSTQATVRSVIPNWPATTGTLRHLTWLARHGRHVGSISVQVLPVTASARTVRAVTCGSTGAIVLSAIGLRPAATGARVSWRPRCDGKGIRHPRSAPCPARVPSDR